MLKIPKIRKKKKNWLRPSPALVLAFHSYFLFFPFFFPGDDSR